MSNYTLAGKLFSATQPEQKSDSFKVRNFVLEVTENGANGQAYTNYIGFQLVNNNCDLINGMVPGQAVTVHFNLRGSLWQDKAITNLQAWKIEAVPAQKQFQQQQQSAPQQQWQQPAPPQQQQQWQQPLAPQPQPQQWQPQQPTPPQQPPQQWQQPVQPQQPAAPPAWVPPNQTQNNGDLPF